MHKEITEQNYKLILKYLEEGYICLHEKQYNNAFSYFSNALNLLPKEKEEWDIALNIYLALGKCSFYQEEYNIASYFFNKALQAPNGLVSGELWLCIGKCFYKQGIEEKAKDAFMSAYMLEGKDIFDEQKIEYFNLIKNSI